MLSAVDVQMLNDEVLNEEHQLAHEYSYYIICKNIVSLKLRLNNFKQWIIS